MASGSEACRTGFVCDPSMTERYSSSRRVPPTQGDSGDQSRREGRAGRRRVEETARDETEGKRESVRTERVELFRPTCESRGGDGREARRESPEDEQR